MRYLIGEYKYVPKSTTISPTMPRTGKLGFSFLGLSFLFWAILMGGSAVDGSSMVFINSTFGSILGVSSIGLTIVGIILTCTILAKISLSRKYLLLSSSVVFGAINLVGYYLLTHSIYGGIAIPDTSNLFLIYLVISSSIYLAFVLIFNFFILPFLNKSGTRLLMVASLFAVLYLIATTISTVYAPQYFSTPSIPSLPGGNMLLSVSFFSPVFGLPGLLLSGGNLNQTSLAMIFSLVSNFIYAILYLSSSKTLRLNVTKIEAFD